MATFQLNPGVQGSAHLPAPNRVRIGSISIFALMIVICLAVLAVLAFSTATASLTMAQRQATATTELYLDEVAAQEFLAGIDALLAEQRTSSALQGGTSGAAQGGSSSAELVRNEWGNVAYDENGLVIVREKGSGNADLASIEKALPDLCAAAQRAADGKVAASAHPYGNRIAAEFSCQNGRLLNIFVTVRDDSTYRIDRWKMSAVQNEEPPEGQLMIIDDGM